MEHGNGVYESLHVCSTWNYAGRWKSERSDIDNFTVTTATATTTQATIQFDQFRNSHMIGVHPRQAVWRQIALSECLQWNESNAIQNAIVN